MLCPLSALLTHSGRTPNLLASIRPVPCFVHTFFGIMSIFIFFVFLNACSFIELGCKDTIIIVMCNIFTKKIAMTKQRILELIKNEGITIPIFLQKTGIKRGFLDSDKLDQAVSDKHVAMIIAAYPYISLEWLLLGKGKMYLKNETNNLVNNTEIVDLECKYTKNTDSNIKNSNINIGGQQVVANHNQGTINADNRQYYSDSPDVLRSQIELLDERIKEKDAQIKEKDAQINKLIELLGKKYESGQ